MERGSALHALLMVLFVTQELNALQAFCMDVFLCVYDKLKGMGILSGPYKLQQFTIKFVQHRLFQPYTLALS